MPRHIHTQTIPGPDGEGLMSVADVVLVLRVAQPPLRHELIWISIVNLVISRSMLCDSDL